MDSRILPLNRLLTFCAIGAAFGIGNLHASLGASSGAPAGASPPTSCLQSVLGLMGQDHLTNLSLAELERLNREMQVSGHFSGAAGSRERIRMRDLIEAKQRAQGVSEPLPASRRSGTRALDGLTATKEQISAVNGAPEIEHLRERHRVFSEVGEADNLHFIELASSADVHPRRLYFEAENAVLKQLNDDILGNKDTVTALTNQYKEILFHHVLESPLLRSRMEAQYSDFKSIRLVFSDNSNEVVAELERVYEKSALEFGASVEATPLKSLLESAHGSARKPTSWHMAGIGSTADEASAATRTSRAFFQDNHPVTPLHSFLDVSGVLGHRVTVIERLRTGLQQELGSSPSLLVPARAGSTHLVLSDGGFEILRKIKASSFDGYVSQVQQKFKSRFKVDLTPDQVLDIRDYAALVDGYTASIVSAKREVIDLSRADRHGVLSFDLAGAGAQNLSYTAAELALSATEGTGAQGAVVGARRAEGQVTAVMLDKVAMIRESVREILGNAAADSVKATGDDVYCFLPAETTQAQRIAVQKGITRRLVEHGHSADRVRSTYQPAHLAGVAKEQVIARGERSGFIVDAEGIEKGLRSKLEGDVGFARLRQVGILVEYSPQSGGGGVMDIVLSGKVDAAMVEKVRVQARALMPKGVELGSVLTTWPPSSPAPTESLLLLTQKALEAGTAHLVVSDPMERAMTYHFGGGKLRLLPAEPRSKPIEIPAKLGVAVETAQGRLGERIREALILSEDGATAVGKLPQFKGAAAQETLWIPLVPPRKVRLILEDGSSIPWNTRDPVPPGLRPSIAANSKFAYQGFSGGHTRQAWDKVRQTYGDLIHEVGSKSEIFRMPGTKREIRVSEIKYEFGPTGKRVKVKFPKTIIDGLTSEADLLELRDYIQPWLAEACSQARPSETFVKFQVPLTDPATGATKLMPITALRYNASVANPIGEIRTWFIDFNQ